MATTLWIAPSYVSGFQPGDVALRWAAIAKCGVSPVSSGVNKLSILLVLGIVLAFTWPSESNRDIGLATARASAAAPGPRSQPLPPPVRTPGARTQSTAQSGEIWSVSGRATYGTPNNPRNPVVAGTAVLVDLTPSHGAICSWSIVSKECALGVTQTAANGFYGFSCTEKPLASGMRSPALAGPLPDSVPNVCKRDQTLQVRVFARGEFAGAHGPSSDCWEVTPPAQKGSLSCGITHLESDYSYSSLPFKAFPNLKLKNFNLDIEPTDDAGRAFCIFDIARMAAQWAVTDGFFLVSSVRFPEITKSGGAEAHGYDVMLPESEAYATDQLMHEFGHVIEYAYGIGQGAGVRHAFGQDLTKEYGKADGISSAWGEGFADFFAVALTKLIHGTRPSRVGLDPPAYWFIGPDGQISGYVVLNKASVPQALGEGDELAVARVLWALDTGQGTGITLSLDRMVHEFKGVQTLSEAVAKVRDLTDFGFSPGRDAVEADRVGCLLADNEVAPRVMAFSNTQKQLDPGRPPTFEWKTGGTPTFPLDRFDVYFLDSATHKPLLLATNVRPDSSSASGIFKWTPRVTDRKWLALVRIVKKDGEYPTVRLEVEGTGTRGVQTGPYPSCGTTIGQFRTTLKVQGLDPGLACSKVATGCVHGPPAPPICGVPPQWSQFAVGGQGFVPGETYDLTLGGTAHGVTENRAIGRVKATDSGKVKDTVFTLPFIPAHDAWTLTAKPEMGGYVPTAKLETGVIDCIALSAGGGEYRSEIAAVGLTPRSTFKEIVNGTTARRIQADGNGTVPTTEVDGSCASGPVHVQLSGYWLDHGLFTDDATSAVRQSC